MSEPEVEPIVYGGCLWPVDAACLTDDWEALEPSSQDRALALASETLRRLTGYRVGGCPITVRPCQQGGCWGAFVPYQGYSVLTPGMDVHGRWVNSCGCGGVCSTGCEIKLPRPIGEVVSVMVDGEELDEDDYEVHNGEILVYTGADPCPFPSTQDLSLPDTEEGTFSVTYLNAYPVDALGAYAAGVLAVEYGKACAGKKCKLPASVTEVVRNGVSYTIVPGTFPGGFTGLTAVDSFIALWNPDNQRPSKVWSPGTRVRHTTVT